MKTAIIGVGINISTVNWPEEISRIAGSLINHTATEKTADSMRLEEKSFDNSAVRERLEKTVADNIFKCLDDMSDTSYMDYYKSHSCVIGKRISFTENGVTRYGIAVDITASGGLLTEIQENGKSEQIVLNSGEITVRTE